jgi:hypothetical protein
MSLNHINLPATVLVDLYSNSLVDTGETNVVKKEKPGPSIEPVPSEGLKWLGNNNKFVLIVVNTPDAVHVPDNELQFLTNMLSACKMTIADVAIVNINKQSHNYKEILKELSSRTALLFEIEPAAFGLPMNFPYFQIQPYAGCSFLYAPSLRELESDKVMKSKLWVSLRRLFNI